ncbi:MAG TPA: AMP-binding protein, partial [Thermoanaerobaculia bacterium]
PLQYADFALWQRRRLTGRVLAEQLAYWRHELAGAPALLALPTDRPRPPLQDQRGARVRAVWPPELLGQLHQLAEGSAATLFMVELAAFQALLSRLSGADDVVVGIPVANRQRRDEEGLIGLFVNTLALRSRSLPADATFRDLLGRTREVALGAFAHQDLPFERLVEELRVERSLAHSPLVQAMLAVDNTPIEALELPGLLLTPVDLSVSTAQLDLVLSLDERDGALAVVLDYSTALYDAPTVRRWLGHFATLLAAVAAEPDRPVAAIPFLSAAERHQLLAEWNATAVARGDGECLHELVAAQAARTPLAVAVELAGETLRYGALDAGADRLAARLRRLGVGPEVLVGICGERSLGLVVGLLAVLKAGGAYVPLDPDHPDDRLAFVLADSGVRVVLVAEPLRARLEALLGTGGAGDVRIVALDGAAESPGGRVAPVLGGAHPDGAAYAIYTSGSTGRPKGAVNTHRAIVNRLLWMQDAHGLDATDRVLQKTPLSFDVSVWELFMPLVVGARLVLARPGGHRDSDYLTACIEASGITTLHFVPSMLQLFLAADLAGCSSLRRVVCSGEALPTELARRFAERLGGPFGVALYNLYGPTEAAVEVTAWRFDGGGEQPGVPIGRPIENVAIHLLD